MMEDIFNTLSRKHSREDIWVTFINYVEANTMAEVGVYKGDFSSTILSNCPSINRYYMIDPWRHLDDWNKPANKDNATFESFYMETVQKTKFAKEKISILRGKTTEVANQINDNELDFAYIDGDHTLRGITIDLIRIYPKVKDGGWIGGDDFCPSIWQHDINFEPTLVFPFAVFFAEAVGDKIYSLPDSQFLIHKQNKDDFSFYDLTGKYRKTELRDQLCNQNKSQSKSIFDKLLSMLYQKP